jgi:hypothetical protein
MLNNTRYHKIGGDEIDEISAASNVKEDPQYSEGNIQIDIPQRSSIKIANEI